MRLMLKRTALLAALAVMIACTASDPAIGSPIGLDDFSSSSTVVDFSDERFPRTNIRVFTIDDVTYQASGPISHRAEDLDTPEIDAFFDNIAGSSGGWYMRTSNYFGDDDGEERSIFDFSRSMNRVGILLASGEIETFTLTAKNENGDVIGQVTAPNPVGGKAVFLGLGFGGSRIRSVEVTKIPFAGHAKSTFFDDLRFETPEPTSALLIGLGLAGLAAMKSGA
jgi:hypothetical protein